MVSKKEKGKRKKNPIEYEDENEPDKFLAYVIKPKKKKVTMESSSVASASKIDSSREKPKIKKKKVKMQIENNLSESMSKDDTDSMITMSISAKPKLYQNAGHSKATNATTDWSVDEATGIELITPKTSLDPVDEHGNIVPMNYHIPRKFECDIEYEKDISHYHMKPVVIEAHLKKPSSYYIPAILRDKSKKGKSSNENSFQNKLTSMNQKMVEKANENNDSASEDSYTDLEIVPGNTKVKPSSTSKVIGSFNDTCSKIPEALENLNTDTSKTNVETNSNAQDPLKESNDKSNNVEDFNTESNETLNAEQDSNIPDALKEFYEEVTKGFENLANKSLNINKKSKKKSLLTVDQSVTDERTLANIVSRNTAQLENTTSTYHPNIAKFFSLENKVILVLYPGAQFSFLGKLKIRVLYGAIELYGSLFNSQNTLKPLEVYSPKGYSSISISTSNTNGMHDKEALWDCLTSEGVDRSLKTKLHDSIQECKDGWTVLLLENFENTLTNFLNSYSSFKLFPKIENMRYSWCDPKRAEYILQAYFQCTCSADEISIGPQWNQNVTKQLLKQWQLTKSMSTVIVGGKGVGKSTTARYLINNLLRYSEKVVLLDLDIGQTEMTPPGCMSLNVVEEHLLGPNFTHLKMPYSQYYLEDVTVTNCMTRYIECAKKLVECLKSTKDLQQYPIVVNTMGFCKGIGLDICIFLIKLIQPSNVVQIMSRRPKNNFEFSLFKQTINEYKTSLNFLSNDSVVYEKICDYELHHVPSVAEGKRQFETWNMEPRQQRELVLLSYLSQIISNADDKNFCNFTSNSINNIIPYTLPFSSFYVALIKSNTSPTHILSAMNGNIVALCGTDLDDETSEEIKETLNYPMVIIKPPSCTCYGYGIVRGIDMKRREIYINTPLKESDLCHVNILVGCTPVPFTLLHGNAPYAGDRGGLPTSREPRRGNFRIDQNKNT
ncbi:polynucleotide 5'-hydroxyl-kinase NOL9 isoform X2 [Phymastichus coffea]|uniref:polynucleotide 5'-hydroxyl-kinase NOL9 isoform X2 n=1 Tax=Phymastichus coffea TaxID=108790 RepID=UPI00273CBC6B|nr:polynucleotide 5'-hydroxyl-kinase NOL9 isoform X2 [Phymastichus coffea]